NVQKELIQVSDASDTLNNMWDIIEETSKQTNNVWDILEASKEIVKHLNQ
ncbi:7120_t:CDS:1, partial [Racocetra persica]